MCKVCGNPDCDGTKAGESIDSVKFTEESFDQAIEIFDNLHIMSVDLNDDTGKAQIEGLTMFCSDANLRPDKFLLIMVDMMYKYILYKTQINQIMNQEKQEEDIPAIPINKKLN